MLKVFTVDPHVHTCLSPCGDLDMHPMGLVRAALDSGLDAVAVCDHNSAGNLAAVVRAGAKAGLSIIPGMEVTSEEEVHMLALMPDTEAAQALQAKVFGALPGTNDEKAFGMQVIADEEENVLGFEEHLLAGATTLSVERVVEAIHRYGGLAVAAHVDRELYSLIGVLGFVPKDLALDALEVSTKANIDEVRNLIPDANRFPLVRSSDAHLSEDIGKGRTEFWVEHITFSELAKALDGREGRRAVVA